MPASLQGLPDRIDSVDELEDWLSRPSEAVIEYLTRLEGDLMFLGVAGKMGPTLARMARRALDEAGDKRRVMGVSRFSNPHERDKLQSWGVQTFTGDLLDEAFVASLPDAANIVYLAGMKFGSSGNTSLTWALNTYLPSIICKRYPQSRIAAFSTGNVYGLVPVGGGGSVEEDEPNPEGEYAMSCLGRERMFEHFSRTQGTPVTLLRLNYACELRYGVLLDLAQKVWRGDVIDLGMGACNVIWQADANAMALLSLKDAATPADVLNVAGPEILQVREICERFGKLLDRPVRFTGGADDRALLNNGARGHARYGPPAVTVEQMMQWIAHWVRMDGPTLNKPTKFEVRDGRF